MPRRHYAIAVTPLASNSTKMERVHIAHGHTKVSVAIEAHIGNRARIKTVANNMGNGVNTFPVTYVDGPATAQVRFVRTGRAESAILRRLTPAVSIEGYPMCRSVLVTGVSSNVDEEVAPDFLEARQWLQSISLWP